MATSADVPNKYDFVINGKGYMSPDTEDVKATYGYTASFVERQNTQGDYGDNFQDFWLTSRQRDWTLGEQQRYFRVNDEDKARRYWRGSSVDVTVPGQVSMRQATAAPTIPAAVTALGNSRVGVPGTWAATATNLYDVTESAVTDWGAHGLGADPQTIVSEGNASTNTYLSGTGAGTVGVRKLSGAAVWSTFSATASDALAYLNNTLYGFRNLTSDLIRYDSAGAITSLFSWKGADGTAFSGATGSKLVPYGPDLLVFRGGNNDRAAWVYDGGGVRKLCDLPFNFYGTDVAVVSGIVLFSGYLTASSGSYPAIYFYANGSIGLLWKADATATTAIGVLLTPFAEGIAFIDASTIPGAIFWFNPATGGVSRIAPWTFTGVPQLASSYNSFLLTQSDTTGTLYPSATCATTATVTHSLMDFDSSLTKTFGGIKVKFDAGTGGNGGSVDIAYRLNDVDGSYTTLQTSAVSGTEYKLTNISGDAISVKITLNKGTSTTGPVLKRVAVRASVKQTPTFRKDTFLIQCTGRDGRTPLVLRDGTFEKRDGLDLATELRAVASAGTAVSMTDEFGTFTGVIENDNFLLRRIGPNEFIASVPVREV